MRALIAFLILFLVAPLHASRIAMSGFELNSLSMEFEASGGTVSIVTDIVHAGTYALRTGPSGTAGYVTKNLPALASGETFYYRFYLYYTDDPAFGAFIMYPSVGGVARGPILSFDSTAGDRLRLYTDGGAQAGGTSAVVNINAWNLVEVSGTFHASAGACTGRLNGVEWVSTTCGNTGGATAVDLGMGAGSCCGGGGSVTGNMYFDDFAVNVSTGSFQTSFPGPGRIIHKYPNGAGDADTAITLVGCVTDAVNCVDETPTPNDATDYANMTATNSVFYVDVTDMGTDMDTPVTVAVVGVGMRGSAASTGGTNYQARIKGQSGGTTITGTSITWTGSTNWSTFCCPGGGTKNHTLYQYVNPQDSAAWTVTSLNSMQIGASGTDGNPDMFVTSVWAAIDYFKASDIPAATRLLMGVGR